MNMLAMAFWPLFLCLLIPEKGNVSLNVSLVYFTLVLN